MEFIIVLLVASLRCCECALYDHKAWYIHPCHVYIVAHKSCGPP